MINANDASGNSRSSGDKREVDSTQCSDYVDDGEVVDGSLLVLGDKFSDDLEEVGEGNGADTKKNRDEKRIGIYIVCTRIK